MRPSKAITLVERRTPRPPTGSKTTSTPRPSVAARTAATTSSLVRSTRRRRRAPAAAIALKGAADDADDPGAGGLAQLDGGTADAADRRVHEQRLPDPQRRPPVQREPGRSGRRCGTPRPTRRPAPAAPGGRRPRRRRRTGRARRAAGPRYRPRARRPGARRRRQPTATIWPQNSTPGVNGSGGPLLVLAAREQHVGEVQGRRPDLDEHLPRPWLGAPAPRAGEARRAGSPSSVTCQAFIAREASPAPSSPLTSSNRSPPSVRHADHKRTASACRAARGARRRGQARSGHTTREEQPAVDDQGLPGDPARRRPRRGRPRPTRRPPGRRAGPAGRSPRPLLAALVEHRGEHGLDHRGCDGVHPHPRRELQRELGR